MNSEQNCVAVAPDLGLPISELAEAGELPTRELSVLCGKKEFATPKLTQPTTLWSTHTDMCLQSPSQHRIPSFLRPGSSPYHLRFDGEQEAEPLVALNLPCISKESPPPLWESASTFPEGKG